MQLGVPGGKPGGGVMKVRTLAREETATTANKVLGEGSVDDSEGQDEGNYAGDYLEEGAARTGRGGGVAAPHSALVMTRRFAFPIEKLLS